MMHARTTAFARLRLEPLELRDVPATLFVDDDKALFRHTPYQSIQAAVDAADPGDKILVAPGSYKEQVTVGDDKDGLTLQSVIPFAAAIKAPDLLAGSKAIVNVNGAEGVSLTGFTVAGPGKVAGNLDVGILVDGGGSATIRGNYVTDIRNDPLSGTQTGIGIQIGGSPGDTSTGSATVVNNVVTRYQKGGIVVLRDGSDAVVKGNTVLGAGPTDKIAQNGIEVSVGATATVTRNLVAGNDYTGGGVVGTGIYVFDAGPVRVTDNLIVGNQLGVLLESQTAGAFVSGNDIVGSTFIGIDVAGEGDGTIISRNYVTGSKVDGIRLEAATGVLVDRNTVTRSGGNGIAVQEGSEGNFVTRNKVSKSSGFDLFDDTTGGGTAGTANFYSGNKAKTTSPAGLP